MRWATRAGCHVDRAACAWLIRRFVDPEPAFVFVDDPDEVPEDATPFDMRGAELSHHDGDCSFETFLRRFELDDPALWELARVVHEADLHDERYDAPEGGRARRRRPRPLADKERRGAGGTHRPALRRPVRAPDAGERSRTSKELAPHRDLNPARLPVPPRPRFPA
jgi:hypothetical protein